MISADSPRFQATRCDHEEYLALSELARAYAAAAAATRAHAAAAGATELAAAAAAELGPSEGHSLGSLSDSASDAMLKAPLQG